MHFVSTKSTSHHFTFTESLNLSMAPDGGLIVPEKFPHFDINNLPRSGAPLAQLAEAWLTPFFKGDTLQSKLSDICKAAFNFPIPLTKLDERASLLELFHGPTCAFKDVGARFLAECLTRVNSEEKTILVATSGDTGGAVAAAFHKRPNLKVWILFPKGKVSLRQELQLTTWGDNISAFSVKGDFDDCQRVVKEAFSKPQLKNRYGLISANSINLGRLLPQAVYYAASSLAYANGGKETPGFIIPSGNLGNATAALWAKRTGMPIGQIVIAHNANRAVANFFQTGNWNPMKTIATIANAMDVGNPSNFERVRHLYPSLDEMKKEITVFSFDDDQIRKSIRDAFDRWGRAVCPHTAAAVAAWEQLSKGNWILVATAHPAKFENIVEPIIGEEKIPIPPALAAILSRQSKAVELEPTLESFEKAIQEENK